MFLNYPKPIRKISPKNFAIYQRKKSKKSTIRFFSIFIGALLLIGAVLFHPWGIGCLSSRPHPVKNYAQSVRRIEELKAREPSGMNPLGRLKFMTHQKKVARAIVFVHGYTNSPQQFVMLGERFYNLGYNVLIAPLPHHGLADRLNAEQAKLTAEELVRYGDMVVDIARGLGQQVVMAGLSGGGNVTAWAAQCRKDLDLAVVISPVFGYRQIPERFTVPVGNIFLVAPNIFRWWEPKLEERGAVPHCYPRFSTRAVAQMLRLGFAVQARVRREAPAARKILVITNANDQAVQQKPIAQLVSNWRKHGANLQTYEFDKRLGLHHDLIDPAQSFARVDLVYPRLIELITAE
jgi:alpha-beta hydrolase superfamily lysophospholipase